MNSQPISHDNLWHEITSTINPASMQNMEDFLVKARASVINSKKWVDHSVTVLHCQLSNIPSI